MGHQISDQQVTTPSTNIKAFLSVMGMALVGMSISAIVVAIQPTFLFNLSVSAQRLGSFIAAVPMLLVIPFCARRPTYPFVYQIVLPSAAALAVVAVFFGMLGLPADIPVLLAYIFYGMVNIAVVATANAVSGAREFPRHLVFSALIGSFCVMTLVGLMLGSAFDGLTTTNHTVFLALMTVLYGVALLLTGCIRSWSLTVRQEGEGQQDDFTDQQALPELLTDKPEELSLPTFEEAVARVSQEGGLTPREQEILSYIGRGHSSVYVAKTLLISESTVYTHVRNIYRKLGVNGREQLILLIGKVR